LPQFQIAFELLVCSQLLITNAPYRQWHHSLSIQHDYQTVHAFSNHARDALGARASTSAVNVGDDDDECLQRTRATPRFASRWPTADKSLIVAGLIYVV